MPLLRQEGEGGAVLVRPSFRPEDYTAPAEALRLFARWGGDEVGGAAGDADAILGLRGNPFGNYVEVQRGERAGRPRIVLLETSREFAIEVEAGASGFGEIRPLPPRQAYDLARARDPLRPLPVRDGD